MAGSTSPRTQAASPDYESDQVMVRMRWLTVILPLCFLLVLLVLELQYLAQRLTAVEAVALGFSLSSVGIVFFSRSVFEVVERLQARLRSQNSDLARRSGQLEAVRVAGLQVAGHISLETVLRQIAQASRDLVGASYAAIAVVREGRITELFTSGLSEDEVRMLPPLPQGLGLLGHVLATGRPYRSADISSDPHRHGFPPGHPQMTRFLGVPVTSNDEVIGNIYLADKESGEFTDDDEQAVTMLAVQAAIAIENARLFEEGREVAVLKERERIARALHDGAIQRLYGVGLQLESCMDRVETEPLPVRHDLDAAIEHLNAIIRDFRSHLFDLRPYQIEGRSLLESIKDLAQDLSVNTLIASSVEVDDPSGNPDPTAGLSEDQTRLLFLIAEESLENVRQHSRARNVRLDMGRSEDRFWMRIADDGIGLDGVAGRAAPGGILEMSGWARALGGDLVVAGRPEGGATVSVDVPLTPDREEKI